jgi:hypothetical protein
MEGHRQAWFQNDRPMKASPWEQVVKNKYALLDWLYGRLGCDKHTFPLSHGHAVLLPDVNSPVGAPMPDINDGVAITWEDADALAKRIEHCSECWRMVGARDPTEHEIDLVRRLFMPEFVYGNTLRDRIGVERRDGPEQDWHPGQLLEFIGNRKRARIAGCAGAGKTMLAVAKARQLAAAGQVVLFLVYNKALCEYLRRHLSDVPGVEVQTFHDFCRERCGADWPASPPAEPDFWWSRVPELLEKALAGTPAQYDALLVDEAQDFQFSAWVALERVLKPDGWYYLFYDKEQNVFKGDLQWPVAEAPFLLLRNCRSTVAILEALARYTGVALQVGEGLPRGEPVREEAGATPGQRRRLLGKILHEWIRKEGLSENQIVVLGAHAIQHTSLGDDARAGSFQLVERGLPAPGTVPYYTYMGFKGCEADAVILLDVDPADNRWGQQGLYTAMTRARHLLAIVGGGEAGPGEERAP